MTVQSHDTDQPQRILLTPGPLTTNLETRLAMLSDWGSRDEAFIAMTKELRQRLLAAAENPGSHSAVLLQGSGTFIVEATIGTLVPPRGKLLVLANGAYGERMVKIAQRLNRPVRALREAENRPIRPDMVAQALAEDPALTHVAVVHCETTTGLINPLAELSAVASRFGKDLLVDAMSSFGALPVSLAEHPITALIASSNKCLEGVPGIGFALIATTALQAAGGNSGSLALDLHDQWRGLEANGQWRFTPPVQVVAALLKALQLLAEEGGPAARLRRYRDNFDCLAAGMEDMGFRRYLDPAVQAPIIATFHQPTEPWFHFPAFYDALAQRGFLIYPGKLSAAETFRVGCIGALQREDFVRFLAAVRQVRDELHKVERSI